VTRGKNLADNGGEHRRATHFFRSIVQARRRGDRVVLGVVGNGRGGALQCPFYRVNDMRGGGRGGGLMQTVVGCSKSFGYGREIVKQMNYRCFMY
jgi:hypothetical protein